MDICVQHDWNELEILAQGNRIRVVCNGTLIVDWRDPDPWRIRAGPIGLQLHSNPDPQQARSCPVAWMVQMVCR
jgi:hypothetical protein